MSDDKPFEKRAIGEKRKVRVALDPGIYEMRQESTVVVRVPIMVDRIEEWRYDCPAGKFYNPDWVQVGWDWDTAQPIPPPVPERSLLERFIDWLPPIGRDARRADKIAHARALPPGKK